MLVEDAGLFGRLERDAVKMVFLQVKSGVVSVFFCFCRLVWQPSISRILVGFGCCWML